MIANTYTQKALTWWRRLYIYTFLLRAWQACVWREKEDIK
jgi:hypothetical protein